MQNIDELEKNVELRCLMIIYNWYNVPLSNVIMIF